MKPSAHIASQLPALRESMVTTALDIAAKLTGYQCTDEDRSEFFATDEGKGATQDIEVAARSAAIINHLDEEAERRAAFETDVLKRLDEMEDNWRRRHEP